MFTASYSFSLFLVLIAATWNNSVSYAHPQGPNSPSPSGHPNQGPGQNPGQGPNGGGGGYGGGYQSSISPSYTWLFEYPLPIPPLAKPAYTDTIDGQKIEYYELTLKDYSHQAYPNLNPTQLTAYDGISPGPTFMIERGTQTVIRLINGCSGPTTMHLHGSYTQAPWDGWATDLIQPGHFKDYYYPNSQPARPLWYHDHVEGNTSPDVYFGQAGVYIIYDPAEESLGLPTGDYDIPLGIADKSYQSNGQLVSPSGTTTNFYGDIIHVNEQPWPFLSVEPRKYRLRMYDMAISRAFDLYFVEDESTDMADGIEFQIVSADAGLFGSPVKVNDVILSMGERYEVVFDFSPYKGKNITLMNDFTADGMIPQYENTDKIMRFVVGDSVKDDSSNECPSSLSSDIKWPEKSNTVDRVFNFDHGGSDSDSSDDIWTINGADFNDVNNRLLARLPQGSTEVWELNYRSGPGLHPVHVHLVDLQIISRTGGSRGVEPYESAGLKDVILLEPGESVQVLATYGPWNGMYVFHCHNLIHEDHMMMDVFDVTKLKDLGYDFADTMKFADPLDAKYTPRASNAAAFASEAIQSTVSELGKLGAYAKATPLFSAESAYYATAGQPTPSASMQSGGPENSHGFGGQHGSSPATPGSSETSYGSSQATYGSSQATSGPQSAAPTQYQGSATISYGGPPTKRAESKAWRA